MIQFIEPHLQKKVILAKHMHMYGPNLPESILNRLQISKSTLQKYENEVNEIYNQERAANGALYSVDSMRKVTQRYFSMSSQIEILRLLFFEPGHKAEYYKSKISISDATFSRNIAQLKKSLAYFEVSLVSKSGYFLVNQNKWHYLLFLTHMSIFYQWDEVEIDRLVVKYSGNDLLKTVLSYDFNHFTFENTEYEQHFFQLLGKLALIQEYQSNHQSKLEKQPSAEGFSLVIQHLNQVYKKTQEKINGRWPLVMRNHYMARLSETQISRLKKLLICSSFQIELFPYQMRYTPLRHYLFEQKYAMAYPDKVKEIDYFIGKMSETLEVEFSYRYSVIFHFLVIEDLLVSTEMEENSIFVFSDLGEKHANYLSETVDHILTTMKKKFVVVPYIEKETPNLGIHDLLITNKSFSLVPKRKQILVDDYLSTNDQIFLEKVLTKVLN